MQIRDVKGVAWFRIGIRRAQARTRGHSVWTSTRALVLRSPLDLYHRLKMAAMRLLTADPLNNTAAPSASRPTRTSVRGM